MIFNKMLCAVSALSPKVLKHPFNKKLCDGTLNSEVFCTFLRQDKVYLKILTEVLSDIAKQLPNEQDQQLFYKCSKETYDLESNMHRFYLSCNTIGFFEHQPKLLSSVTNYTNHLQHTVKDKPVSSAIASCLACFYWYSELGEHMKKSGMCNTYAFWINTYLDPAFLSATKSMIGIANKLASNLKEEEQQDMVNAFVTSTNFEIAFWDEVISTSLVIPESPVVSENRIQL